jgi:hypothetical protein
MAMTWGEGEAIGSGNDVRGETTLVELAMTVRVGVSL